MNQIMHLKTPRKDFKIVAITIFLLIMGFLILTAFYGFTFTGNIIKNLSSGGGNSTIELKADLTIPNLELEGKFGEVKIKGGSNSNLFVGNQKFYLGNSDNNFISLKDYNGKISLDSNRILYFKGKAVEVSVNGIPITSEVGGTLSVRLDEDFKYSLLEVKGGVSIKELNYITSGTIRINSDKNVFRIGNDEVTMSYFQGDISIERDKFKIDGKVRKLEIKGAQGILITA